MVYTLVRPSSLPYDGYAAYGAYFGTVSNIPATFTGNGSLSDDSDSTGVTLRASTTPEGYEGSIIAVDFAPQPGLTGSELFGSMFRLQRHAGFPEPLDSDTWQVFANGVAVADAARLSDAAGNMGDIPTDAPATFQSGNGWYLTNDMATLRTQTFTLAISVDASVTPAGTVIDTFTLFECGLLLDLVTGRRPSLRQLQRGGRGGIGGIPRAIGDRTRQGSLRRGTSYIR